MDEINTSAQAHDRIPRDVHPPQRYLEAIQFRSLDRKLFAQKQNLQHHEIMTKEEFCEKHLEHRKMVLKGFLNRAADESHEGFRAKMDGAIVTCRSLWELLGVQIDSKNKTAQEALLNSLKFITNPNKLGDFECPKFQEENFKFLPRDQPEKLKKVLIAGNKCVAHFDQYPDHDVTPEILDDVISFTLKVLADKFQINDQNIYPQ